MCLDSLAVSSDPTSAYLMDGHVVASWAEQALLRQQAQVGAASEQSSASSDTLSKAAAAARDLALVAEALACGGGGAAAALGERLARWCQYVEALGWLSAARVPPPRHIGLLARRREAARPHPLFLDDLLEGAGKPAYPAPDAASAAKAIFLAGGADEASLSAKAALFMYYLLDAGAAGGPEASAFACSSASAGRLSAIVAAQVRAGFLLDQSPDRAASLGEAAALLTCGACGTEEGPTLRFSAVLGGKGAHAATLHLLRGYRGGAVAASAREACEWVHALLAVRSVRNAFAAASSYTASQPSHAARCQAASELVPLIAQHCEASRAMGELIALPWTPCEEDALARWLLHRAHAGALAAEALPSLYLARRRGGEALLAHAQLEQADEARGGPAAGLPKEDAAKKLALVAARRRLMATQVLPGMPPAQARLVVGAAGDDQDSGVAVLTADDASAALTLAAAAAPDARGAWALRVRCVEGRPTALLTAPATLAARQVGGGASAPRSGVLTAAPPPPRGVFDFSAALAQLGEGHGGAEGAPRDLRVDFEGLASRAAAAAASGTPALHAAAPEAADAAPSAGGESVGGVARGGAPSVASPFGGSAAAASREDTVTRLFGSPAPAAPSMLFGRTPGGEGTPLGAGTRSARAAKSPAAALLQSPAPSGVFSTRRATRAAASVEVAGSLAEHQLLRQLAQESAAAPTPASAARTRAATPNKRPRRNTAQYE